MKKICNDIIISKIIILIAGYISGFALAYLINDFKKPKTVVIPTPVEKEVIDTLYITRDSLIYRTKYLETIKHDTIEKVYRLNDSSSIDLFYKLVSE